MKNETVTISLGDSPDASAMALCVQTACNYRSSIYLTDGIRRINAKSIMGMLSLGIAIGDEVQIEANGDDEENAVHAMKAILEGN